MQDLHNDKVMCICDELYERGDRQIVNLMKCTISESELKSDTHGSLHFHDLISGW